MTNRVLNRQELQGLSELLNSLARNYHANETKLVDGKVSTDGATPNLVLQLELVLGVYPAICEAVEAFVQSQQSLTEEGFKQHISATVKHEIEGRSNQIQALPSGIEAEGGIDVSAEGFEERLNSIALMCANQIQRTWDEYVAKLDNGPRKG